MRDRTTFHFINAMPGKVRARVLKAANGHDVVLAGSPSTVPQFLAAGLIDELHLAIAPILLGSRERLLDIPQLSISRHVRIA